MTDHDKTKDELIAELNHLRYQLAEQQSLQATTWQPVIEQAKKEWETTADSLPHLICLLDQEQRVLRANRTIEVWGVTSVSQVKGKTIPALLHGEAASYLADLMAEAWPKIARGEVVDYEVDDPILCRHLRIQLRPVLSTVTSVYKNQVSFASITFEDITTRKQTEQALHESHEKLEQQVAQRTAELATTNINLKAEISERRKAEETLRLLEAAVLASIDGITISDPNQPDNPLIYINPGFETMTGYRIEEVLGKNCRFLQGPETDQPALDELRRALRQGEECRVLLRNYHKDGRLFWNELTVYPLRDEAGNLTHYVGIQRDTTARKQAEETIQASESQYRWLARQLIMLNKASRTINATLDLSAILNHLLAELKPLFEIQEAAILLPDPANSTELICEVVAPSNMTELIGQKLSVDNQLFRQAIENQRAVLKTDIQADESFPHTISQLTGQQPRSILVSPMIHQNQVRGLIVVFHSTADHFNQEHPPLLEALANSVAIALENARLYQAEREQHRRLQQSQAQMIQIEKMAALGRLMASVIHEINNPIQAIFGFLILAQELVEAGPTEQDEDEDDLKMYLETANREVRRLADLSKRLREFYRAPRQDPTATDEVSLERFYQSVQADLQAVELPDMVAGVLSLTAKELRQFHITVEQNWADDLPPVEGNPSYLRQVLLNLILNAIQAMDKKAGQLQIQARLDELTSLDQASQPAVRLTVQDNGSGMAPETLARIFEPLFTTKKEGTGIGLFTSYKIIQAHQGQIEATSQLGEGTTFTIWLPVA